MFNHLKTRIQEALHGGPLHEWRSRRGNQMRRKVEGRWQVREMTETEKAIEFEKWLDHATW